MKINLKPRTMMYPAPAVVASAYDEDGNPDCCTLAFATMCSHHPPAVMIAINSTLKRKTLADILKSNEFCIGFPSCEHMDETDYFGIESGYNQNKLEKVNFSYRDAEMVNAPIIEEFKVSVECRVMNIAEVGSHTQVTGEIVNMKVSWMVTAKLFSKNWIRWLTMMSPIPTLGWAIRFQTHSSRDENSCR